MSDKEKEDVLITLRKSRKAYLPEYLCGGLLFILLLIAALKGVVGTKLITYPVFGLGIACLASAEISRMMYRYKITANKLILVHGLIKQNKKHVYFFPLAFIPDIDVEQGRIQRLLNYGTIAVKGGSNRFELKDIDYPHVVMRDLENLVQQTREIHRKKEDG